MRLSCQQVPGHEPARLCHVETGHEALRRNQIYLTDLHRIAEAARAGHRARRFDPGCRQGQSESEWLDLAVLQLVRPRHAGQLKIDS